MILWETVNGPRPYGTTTREVNYYRNVERILMAKTVEGMTEDELIAEIQRLQSVRVPSTKPKAPKRMDDAKRKKDPTKRGWRDSFFESDGP
jgi:hypothetical protein